MHNSKIHIALWTIIGVASLTFSPAIAYELSDFSVPDPGPGVCMDCGNDTPETNYDDDTGYAPAYDDSAERAARQAQVEAVNTEATAAYERGDYREALRLYYEQQQLRDGPNVQQDIAAAKEMIARAEAERERLDREARQRVIDEENRRKREIQDIQTAEKMREKIETFAASLDTARPTAGLIVTERGETGDILGTRKANAPLAFGDPDALEASGEQARQGFDKDGPFMGSKPVPRSADPPPGVDKDPASHDPQMIAAEKELAQLGVERLQIDKEIDDIKKARNTASDPEKMKKLSATLEKKYEAKAEKLLDISNKEEKNKKLRMTINTKVKGDKEKSK